MITVTDPVHGYEVSLYTEVQAKIDRGLEFIDQMRIKIEAAGLHMGICCVWPEYAIASSLETAPGTMGSPKAQGQYFFNTGNTILSGVNR
jgi:hypothetical protein